MNEYREFQAIGGSMVSRVPVGKKDSICHHTKGMDVTEDIEGPVYRCIECGERMPLSVARFLG